MTKRGRAILLAGLLDAALGDPRRYHPVAGFGTVAAAIEARVWAPSRARGALYAAALVGAAGALGRLFPEAVVLWASVGGRSLAEHAERLARLVEDGDLEGARRLAPTLMGRDASDLDGAELCRGAVESVAENTADAVVGALFWHVLLGPGGSAAYRAANTLDAMVGHRSPRYGRFGWAAARLDDALTWPAARIGALLAVVLGGRPAEAWQVLRRDGRAHPSPNAGLLEATWAGSLGIRLGGTLRYGGCEEERPAIGAGARPGPADVRRAVTLSRRTGLAATLLAAVIAR